MDPVTKHPSYAKIVTLKEELRKARFDLALDRLSDVSKLSKLKKEIAREYTKISLQLKEEKAGKK